MTDPHPKTFEIEIDRERLRKYLRAVVQGPLMRRYGVEALRMSTVAAGGQNSFLTIHGVKDCLRVRDMLAEIDSQRENG